MCSQQCLRGSPLNAPCHLHRTPPLYPKEKVLPAPRCHFRQVSVSYGLLVLSHLCFVAQCLPMSPHPNSAQLSIRQRPFPQSSATQSTTVSPADRDLEQAIHFVRNSKKGSFSFLFPVSAVVAQAGNSTEYSSANASHVWPKFSKSTSREPILSQSIAANETASNVPNSQLTLVSPREGSSDTSEQTTLLEVFDQSPLILNFPISGDDDLDPLVKSIFANGTFTGANGTSIDDDDITQTSAGNHLVRAARKTHQNFIKRILNAVTSNGGPNRHVYGIRTQGRPSLQSDSVDHMDLGLPADIAHEYIDGVNPPKFPGLNAFRPLIENADIRNGFKPKFPGVSVVDPNQEMPNLYSKPILNDTQSNGEKGSIFSKPAQHLPPPKHFQPMQPSVLQQTRPSPFSPLQTLDNLSLNNRNVLKPKLPSAPLPLPAPPTSSSANRGGNSKHDLSLLLKQEFDAKNAELNQTKAESLAISPGGQLLVPHSGPKVFSVSSKDGIEQLLEGNITFPSKPLAVPPYQLPQSPTYMPVNTSSMLLPPPFSGHNNENLKEGFHYRPVAVTIPTPTNETSTKKLVNSRRRNSTTTTKRPKQEGKESERDGEKNTFVRIRTGLRRRPKPKSTTTTTERTRVAVSLTTALPTSSTRLPYDSPPSTPKFVSTISNDVRFQVVETSPSSVEPMPTAPSGAPEGINDLELNSDESRLFNTSLDTPSPPMVNTSSVLDDSVSKVPTKQSTMYRLTTERLAYILIGSCCGLAVLVLVIVAMSVRCKDMCTEYHSWKSAEKAALRWHRHNRGLRGFGTDQLPYPAPRGRFNLPRYFRTSIDNAKLRQPPLGSFAGGTEKPSLDNILLGKPPKVLPESSSCCHCVNCSSTWVFRNVKHGAWCCPGPGPGQGYLQPPRRNKLPFGAASSVNTFMPRFTVDHSGEIKSTRQEHGEMTSSAGSSPAHRQLGRMQRNASEPNLEMFFTDQDQESDTGHAWHNQRLDRRMREKASSSGAIPVKVSKAHRFNDNTTKCKLVRGKFNSGPVFCEIDDDDDDEEDEGNDHEPAKDFTRIFETNFGEGASHHHQAHNRGHKSKLPSACRGNHHSSTSNLYHQKCLPPLPSVKHKSDQSAEKARRHRKQSLPEYYNPFTGKYYFDSTSIKNAPATSSTKIDGERSSIWINSSKIVDKLHRKHQTGRPSHTSGAGGQTPRNGGPSRPPVTGHRLSTPGDRTCGGGGNGHHHREQSSFPGTHCSHFDPNQFAHLGVPSRKTSSGAPDNEHFVVWNDTNERLI